jgi:hypothetical protein
MNEAMLKALFIYNFSKYIEWPQSKLNENFIIGVYGQTDVLKELEQISKSKQAKGLPIVVKQIDDVAQTSTCNIVFIAHNEIGTLKEIDSQNKENGVLIVTEDGGSNVKGFAINIIEQQQKVRFELNEAAARKAGLKISSELILLASKN